MRTERHPIVQEDLKRITSSELPWEQFSGKTVLIAGAGGFVPAYMLETLLFLNDTRGAGIRVVAMVRNREKAMRRLGHLVSRPDLTVHVQDVREGYAGQKPVDFVIHAASQASPKFFGSDPVGTFEANVIGTQHLLRLAHESSSKGFLFFSSGEVYGQPSDPSVKVKESDYGYIDPLNVRSCYSEGKRAGETLCTCWHAQYGVPVRIVRLSHTYGPGMELNDGRVFADFVADIVAGRDIVLKSDGSARRPFCYLADATVGFFKVLLQGGRGRPTTWAAGRSARSWSWLRRCAGCFRGPRWCGRHGRLGTGTWPARCRGSNWIYRRSGPWGGRRRPASKRDSGGQWKATGDRCGNPPGVSHVILGTKY